MSLATRNTRGDSGLSTPVIIAVCVASSVVALTLGALTWIFIARKRNKNTPPVSPSTESQSPSANAARLPRRPEATHFADSDKDRDYPNRFPSPKPSPPPAYSPGGMKSSTTSSKKPAPALNLDPDCDTGATTLPSPIRSASFNPSTKTQSIGSRISSRISMSPKKLPRLMVVAALYVPSLSDELPIRLGETIRMIEEFEDEWCLVQRVGRTDEKGVVPRFCLAERQEIIPRTGHRSSSGLFQTSTFRK